MKRNSAILTVSMSFCVWGQSFFPLAKNNFWAYTSLTQNAPDSHNSVTGDTVLNGRAYFVIASIPWAGFPFSGKYVRVDSNRVYRASGSSEVILFDLNKSSVFNSPSNTTCHWRYASDTVGMVFGVSDSLKTFYYGNTCLDGAGSLTLSKRYGMIAYRFTYEPGVNPVNFTLKGAIIGGITYGDPTAIFDRGSVRKTNFRSALAVGQYYRVLYGGQAYSLLGRYVSAHAVVPRHPAL